MKKNLIILITSAFLFSCSGNNSENKENNADLEAIKVYSTDQSKDVSEKYTSKTYCDEDPEHPEDGGANCITKIFFATDKYPDLEVSGRSANLTSADFNQDGQEELIHAYSPRGSWTIYTIYALANSKDPKNAEWQDAFSFSHNGGYREGDIEPSQVYWLPKENKVKLIKKEDIVAAGEATKFFDWKVE